MTDEPFERLEELVARRIREQLGEGRLDELLRIAFQQGRADAHAQFSGEGELRAHVEVGVVSSAELSPPPGEVVAVIESASPELANDIRGRSPQDINFVLNFYMAIMQTLQLLLTVYQIVHGEQPSHQQVIEIFNQTTNVINQTTNVVVNMPSGH
ncbi:hypothetical protein [Mycobacterium sp.]|uniref:hypothetical protein n=1 Tax=Mycobacterium sp. TaxID=1785 RepID=UPI002BC1FF51|nr:hypothetical protein [Mycobacterium sp.]HKP41795.1 hypothetical protein [Mycobacterium sp.]